MAVAGKRRQVTYWTGPLTCCGMAAAVQCTRSSMLQVLQKEEDLQQGEDRLRPTRQPLQRASAMRITELRPASLDQW